MCLHDLTGKDSELAIFIGILVDQTSPGYIPMAILTPTVCLITVIFEIFEEIVLHLHLEFLVFEGAL
jgi:hypothetical protein